MLGPIVLVGSGESTAAMDAIDRDLLAATHAARPRVAVLPTASWPDGDETFLGWIRGTAHFAALGAEVEGVEIRTREDAFDEACVQAIGEADLVYLSGGTGATAGLIAGTPAESALRAVNDRGAILAGSSAGAMALAACQPRVGGRRFFRFPTGWRDALGFVDGAAVLPHYDAFPEPLAARSPSPRRGGSRPWDRRGHGGDRAVRRLAGGGPRPRNGLAGSMAHPLSGGRPLPPRRPGGRSGAGRRRGGLTVPTAPEDPAARRSWQGRSPWGAVGCRRVSRP